MTLLGEVRNGKIELNQAVPLPEGTKVRLELAPVPTDQAVDEQGQTLGQKLMKYAGVIQDERTDLARNHDHYLHGAPKK